MRHIEEPALAGPFFFPGVPMCIQEYLLCVLFHLLLPLLPLVVEDLVLGHVERKTLLLFMSVYPLNIGVLSQSKLLFGIAVVISVFYSLFFGLATGDLSIPSGVYSVGYLSVATVTFIHLLERYNRHISRRKPFLEFT